jgi:hypothetical protein
MKIPLDFFLNLIKKFLNEIELKDVSKVLSKHIDISESEYVRKYKLFTYIHRMKCLAK